MTNSQVVSGFPDLIMLSQAPNPPSEASLRKASTDKDCHTGSGLQQDHQRSLRCIPDRFRGGRCRPEDARSVEVGEHPYLFTHLYSAIITVSNIKEKEWTKERQHPRGHFIFEMAFEAWRWDISPSLAAAQAFSEAEAGWGSWPLMGTTAAFESFYTRHAQFSCGQFMSSAAFTRH